MPSTPKDYAGHSLQNMFGMMEYEQAIETILRYLADDEAKIPAKYVWGWDLGTGWKKLFRIDTFDSVSCELFAMLCAAGWITENYFPKYTFRLSGKTIARLEESSRS